MNNHLNPEEMLALLDGELATGEEHLQACEVCRSQLEEMRSGIDEYLDWHERVVRPLAPPPPAPWMDLWERRPVLSAPARRPGWRIWWMLAPAAVAAMVLVYIAYHRIPAVQAAELLEKAVMAAPPAQPGASIRIHTRTRDFVRPAVLSKTAPAQDGELPRLFADAQFDWEQPFSAVAFAEWRHRLTDNRDEVEYRSAICRITTSSASSVLARATLILRSSDLAPLSETLEFRESETVEISTAAAPVARPEGIVAPPAVPALRPGVLPAAALPQAALTLHVLAALHGIGADLGELEVRGEEHRVKIGGAGLSAARRDEIRQALAGIDGVDIDFASDSSNPAAAPPARQQNQKTVVPAPLRSLLESRIPEGESIEDIVNRILDASDSIMARAFALRTLARQYPLENEQSLSAADHELLTRLRADHGREMNTRFDQLARLLAPLISSPPAPAATASTWQQAAEQAFISVQSLDSLLSATLAGSPRGTASQAELLQQLADAVRRAQAAVRAAQ